MKFRNLLEEETPTETSRTESSITTSDTEAPSDKINRLNNSNHSSQSSEE